MAASSALAGSSTSIGLSFPDLEEKFAGISSHATVLGFMVLSRSAPVTLVRSSGTIFEGERGRNYATSVSKMVDAVQGFLEDVSEEGADKDEVKFMRIRSERHELMITPHERYLLVVLHNPSSANVA